MRSDCAIWRKVQLSINQVLDIFCSLDILRSPSSELWFTEDDVWNEILSRLQQDTEWLRLGQVGTMIKLLKSGVLLTPEPNLS